MPTSGFFDSIWCTVKDILKGFLLSLSRSQNG